MRKATPSKKPKRVGRPPVGSKGFHVRLRPSELAALDAWIERQPDPQPNIPEAIRRLTARALACEGDDNGR